MEPQLEYATKRIVELENLLCFFSFQDYCKF
jgi:hypothetical protein